MAAARTYFIDELFVTFVSSSWEISSIGFNLLPPGFASHPEIFEGNRLLLLSLLCDLNRKIVQFF